MIPVKIDANPITASPEKSLKSFVDWFEQKKKMFYTLGWSYLRNQKQMEELFYRVILSIHKELPRLKKETSFEIWAISIFIHTCRELSSNSSIKASEESAQQENMFHLLDQLSANEKEAIILTYVIGISLEESASILQVSAEEMKVRLFSGIRSLREKLGDGSPFDGCKEHHVLYIDYLSRTLDRPKKIEFERHVHHCESCQEDLATFQEIMLSMPKLTEMVEDDHMPSGFLEKVKGRLEEEERRRQQRAKKYKNIGLIFVSAIAVFLCTGIFTGWFSSLYYSWTEENQELRPFLQYGQGERLNLEAESAGVKITIKSAIADDVQTLIFYEIEDMNENNQYMMNFFDGVSVENESKIMNRGANPKYYPPNLKNEVKNVYQGKMSLLPLKTDDETIKLKVTRIQKLIHDPSNPDNFRGYGEVEYETGEWDFEIPVTKSPSTELKLDKEIEIEGIPIRFNKLTIAPTATLLHYAIQNTQIEKRLEFVNFDSLEVNREKAEPDPFGGSYPDPQQGMDGEGFLAHFDPLFEKRPKEVRIQFGSVYLSIEDHKIIEIDASKQEPQLFEYAGSTISIDKVEVGTPSKMVMSNHQVKNRQYENFYYRIIGENDTNVNSMEIDTEAVIVDRSGKEYDMNEIPVSFDQLDQPRHFITVQKMEFFKDNAGENVIPRKLEIFGYNTTRYVDNVVEIMVD